MSTESGRAEVYIAPFPGPGRKWQVSTKGGFWPQWRGDGRELFFMRGNSILAVEVRTGGGVRVGEERVVLTHDRLIWDEYGDRIFDSMPGGGLLVSIQEESEVVLRVVLGFGGETP